jgi:hypothetical protein
MKTGSNRANEGVLGDLELTRSTEVTSARPRAVGIVEFDGDRASGRRARRRRLGKPRVDSFGRDTADDEARSIACSARLGEARNDGGRRRP